MSLIYFDEDDNASGEQSPLSAVIDQITKDIGDNPAKLESDEFLNDYRGRIQPLITQNLKQNLITDIIDSEAVPVETRGFLLKASVPGNWELLKAETDKGKGTALHQAIDRDNLHRVKTMWKPSTFASILCNLMELGIQDATLEKRTAVEIISKRRGPEGPTCLHLALRADMTDVAIQIIRLSDEDALLLQRENGNTPLHDAVEFISDFNSKIIRKFLVQAPRCSTPARKTPMTQFVLDVQKGKAQDKAPDCCKRCLEVDNQYQIHKGKHAEILCALLHRGRCALAVANGAGEPPYVYHIRGRESFKKSNPGANETMEKHRRHNADRKREANSGTGNLNLNLEGHRPEAEVSSPRLERLQVANSSAPREALHAIHREKVPTTAFTKCPITSDPPDCFYMSIEVETLLWDESFRLGGYEMARQCLFPFTAAKESPDLDGKHDLRLVSVLIRVKRPLTMHLQLR